MKALAALVLALAAVAAKAERILLIPLDSRPAAGQFAQMIGKMASVEVRLPPYQDLGRFTDPGSPDAVLDWLDEQDLSDVSAIVVSADMIAYGGLIASRTDETAPEVAVERLKRLSRIRDKKPSLKLYVFSSIMRLFPTATKQAAPWRMQLGRLAELRDRYRRTRNPTVIPEMQRLEARVPQMEMQRYLETRLRDSTVQRSLVYMTQRGMIDYLVIGQDDARPYGPHVSETNRLEQIAEKLKVAEKVYFCEGIDQHANVLVSRALLKNADWTPRVRIVYSDESAKDEYANFETKPIEKSLEDQILASGARLMGTDGVYDYSLYVNTPGRREELFKGFLEGLESDIDQGFPAAVADINLGKDGTSDPELFEGLWRNQRMMKLLSFAGWNTAGNTLGTSIPAANVYLLARRERSNPLNREVAQREFLLHRYVNDYAYHKFTRPQAYALIDSSPHASREEVYGKTYSDVDDFVRRDLSKHLEQIFRDQFLGKRFFAGTSQYVVTGISDIKIFLPWPRAYEVRLEFRIDAQLVVTTNAPSNRDQPLKVRYRPSLARADREANWIDKSSCFSSCVAPPVYEPDW